MPHLWMFLLQALTPPGHEVLLIDGNAQPMDEAQIAQYVRDQKIELVGIGAMTRMIAKAYRIADAIRATGVPVVMGGPHVTELADEALGRDGGPRHADAVALGEADDTWPQIVNDAARGELKEIYAPVDRRRKRKQALPQAISRHSLGQDRSPSVQSLCPKPSTRCSVKSAKAGERFASSPSSPDAAALTVASSAPSPDSSATPSVSAPTKAWSTNFSCSRPAPAKKKARWPSSSSTTISPSTSSAPSRCSKTSSPPKRKFIGSRRSAPTCCATKNSSTSSPLPAASGFSSAWNPSTRPTSKM